MNDTPHRLRQASEDYRRVERAIRFLEAHFKEQPSLARLARSVGLSEYHFHRLFTRWAGTTPKRFLQFLTSEYAKERLRRSHSVFDVALDAGLSGGGRLHDLLVTLEAVSPGEFKRRGAGLEIRHGVHPTPFGSCLLAVTERGVCGLEFLAGRSRRAAVEALAARWPEASLRRSPEAGQPYLARIFPPPGAGSREPLTVAVRGTNFQLKVWQALLRIPPGETASYSEVARAIGRPSAARAVGGAVGRNPVAYLIPCHRVIRSAAGFGDYRWGVERKRAMLGWEAARSGLPEAAIA